jgi:hypothetical protein
VSSSSREPGNLASARSLGAASVAVAVATLVSGCGGSGGPRYTLSATQACLNGTSGVHAVPQQNRFLTGSGGNLMVTFGFGSPTVYLAFGKDSSEAQTLENRGVSQAERYQSIPKQVILDGVSQKGNVFYYSDAGALTLVARAKVEACLR